MFSTRYIPLGVGLLALVVLPHLVPVYQVEVLIVLLLNLILAQSYRLANTTGDWSLSHIVLMGVGAYAAALLARTFGIPFLLNIVLASMIAAAVGLLLVLPLLRTSGFGFFIGSFALGEFIRLGWIKFQNPFGGSRGLVGIPQASIGPWDLFGLIEYYYVVLAFVVVSMWILWRIDRSALGDAFKAIYMDRLLCESVGIRVPRYRALAFSVAAFFAGTAGALMAHHQGAIDPHNFSATLMVYLIIFVVVGGVKTFWGPVLGVIVMTAVFELTRPWEAWRPLVAGVVLIIFLVLLPGGLELMLAPARRICQRIPGIRGLARPGVERTGADA